jgi:4'-phosphopantetheinyl transferase
MTHDPLRVGLTVWPHASLVALLDGCEVLVCSASLEADDRTVRDALAVLDPNERERFERYENAEVARRFAVGRLRLREMLGSLLGVPAAAVPITLGLHGKPALARAAQAGSLRFSVAHCDELLLVAVTRLGDVGVDVERIREIERWSRVADRVFGPTERAAIGREIANGDDPSAVFFRFWCRGEAELKAIGCGISGRAAEHRATRGARGCRCPVSGRRCRLRRARFGRAPESDGSEPGEAPQDHADERVHGVVESAIDRCDHERSDDGRDHRADASLIAQRTQRRDERRRDV